MLTPYDASTPPRLSREEIGAMLGLTDLVKDSRFYQETRAEALQEGREEGAEREKALILRQLQRKLGELPEALREQVSRLPLATLETLGEVLFDFEVMVDLQRWIEQQTAPEES